LKPFGHHPEREVQQKEKTFDVSNIKMMMHQAIQTANYSRLKRCEIRLSALELNSGKPTNVWG